MEIAMAPGTVVERMKSATVLTESDERKEGLVRPNTLDRAYTGVSLAAGICGALLPPLVVAGGILLAREWSVKGSLSAYYHSGMRDVFVGILCIVGFFLVCYHVFDRKPENFFSLGAGIGAVGLALFPTRLGEGASLDALTPLQERIGQNETFYIHVFATILFFVSLVILCLGFAFQERARKQTRLGPDAAHSPIFWFRFHLIAVAVMLGGLLIIVGRWFAESQGSNDGFVYDYATLVGESMAIFAFGVSWWAKGSEFRKLRADVPSAAPESAPEPSPAPAPVPEFAPVQP
jgi:hypothetical protein